MPRARWGRLRRADDGRVNDSGAPCYAHYGTFGTGLRWLWGAVWMPSDPGRPSEPASRGAWTQVASGVGCGGRENVLGLACVRTYMETG